MTYQLISRDIDEEENGGEFATNNSYVSFRNADFKGGGTWYEGAATMETKITLTPYVDTHKVPHALYTIHGQVIGDDGYPIAGIVISSSLPCCRMFRTRYPITLPLRTGMECTVSRATWRR